MRKPDGQTMFLGSALIGGAALLIYLTFYGQGNGQSRRSGRTSQFTLADIPFDGQSAFSWIERLCELGSRASGSEGMKRQQTLLVEHFRQLGGVVQLQQFVLPHHPISGSPVPMANLIVRWHPDRRERILLCAHYDTRPYPDEDPDPARRKDVFVGANDGASGVAVLAELGKHMPRLDGPIGVDFALFDAEEFVFSSRDRYFLGSEYFARQYISAVDRGFTYRAAVLLDMVGDAQLDLYQERTGLSWRDSRPLIREIWATARRLGVREFVNRPRFGVQDDHVMLHDVGRIPACDIIDFNYGGPARSRRSYWHTTHDTPDKCSALSLAKVGWVVLEWLKSQKPSGAPDG